MLYADFKKKLNDFELSVSFSLEDGVLAMLGASGCGKSMTLKCIAGIEHPDSGRIVLNGRVLYDSEAGIDLPPQDRRVGYLFQQYALFPNMSVEGNIRAGIRGGGNKADRVRQAITRMRLEGLENRMPGMLSGGEQQRVALARILVNAPELLLLDEPFSALDSHLRFQMEETVRHAIRTLERPAILVSHDRDEAYRLSNKIAIVDSGHIEVTGDRDELFSRPITRNAAVLTGCKNISAIDRLSDGSVLAKDWGVILEVDDPVSDARYVGIRMHSITSEEKENRFRCRVIETVENPFSVTVNVRKADVPDARCIRLERSKAAERLAEGDEIEIGIPKRSIMLLR